MITENDAYGSNRSNNPMASAFEARRRRKNRNRDAHNFSSSSDYNNNEENPISNQNQNQTGRKGRGRNRANNTKDLPKEEADPYDSDPGESYRDHCERIQQEKSKSCLAIPRFLKDGKTKKFGRNNSVANNRLQVKVPGDASGATEPPSPLISEPETNKNMPSSLPRDLARVRYSLRTSIGDGTERQPGASATMMERRELRPNNIHINVSHWSDFGGRNYMEDRYAIEDMGAVQVEVSPLPNQGKNEVEVTYGAQQRKNRRLKMPLTWLGVFDGHGGDKASQFCSDWMSSYVRNEESYPFDLGYAMKNAFTSIDEDFVATGQPDGSTACAATLVGGRRIVCANAGDSRAIVVRRDGTVVRLSRDHKPGMPDETRRISELGGRVIYWGRWRVEGLLAVSRSVGDASLKPYVTAEPEVCEYDIGKDDWFLVLSSDGVWDVMDNEEAAHVVIASSCVMDQGQLKIDTNRFKWAARNLCDHAKSCGSTDNFSCVVVDLKSCGNPYAKEGRYLP